MAGCFPALARKFAPSRFSKCWETQEAPQSAVLAPFPSIPIQTSEFVSETLYNEDFLPTPRPSKLSFRLGMATNIGGLKENQDDGFIWKHKQSESLVFAVIDGHGEDHGKFSAQQIRLAMLEWLELNFFKVFESPGEAIRSLFSFAHEKLFKMFQTYLRFQGFETKVKNGYLLKSSGKSNWLNVKGGATVSIVIILQNGSKMYTANLGDCTGILSTNGKTLSKQMLEPLYAEHELEGLKFSNADLNEKPTNLLEITWDHGPECPREFRRMRAQRSSEEDPRLPYLTAIYDMEGRIKIECPRVFSIDNDGNPSVTNNGQIYKNVRREWASRVVTPANADFQDGLAVTRALGDFPMQSCGLTSVPDIFELKIDHFFDETDAQCGKSESKSHEIAGIIFIASDGIWDNWKYEQVSSFFLNPVRTESVASTATAEQQIEEFMQLNYTAGESNFGSEADNATGIVCYIYKSK